MKTRRMCKAERLSSDRISTLPQPVIETILCLLESTEEAARTSILSREWRYKWTTIPKLELYPEKRVMSQQTSDITDNMDARFEVFYDLHQVMVLRRSPIQELTLNMGSDYDFLEFDQILLSLSRNHTVKKLQLAGLDDEDNCWYKFPMSIFSMHHLTDLDLIFCELDHPPIFSVLCSLQSLSLWDVKISTKTLLHILSNSPSLKTFSPLIAFSGDKCTINELFKCLPAVERLTTWRDVSEFKWLVLDSVPQELPTPLIHLKYFRIGHMVCLDDYVLAFLLVLIKCSPNLENISLTLESGHDCYEEYSVVWEDYSNVWLEHLTELEIEHLGNSKREMEFVKFFLARSPKLKKVSIRSWVEPNQESEMLKTLFEAPRASPAVITVESCYVDIISLFKLS